MKFSTVDLETSPIFTENISVSRDFDSERATFEAAFQEYILAKSTHSYKHPSPELSVQEKRAFKALPLVDQSVLDKIPERQYSSCIEVFADNSDKIIPIWKDLDLLMRDKSFLTPENCKSLLSRSWNIIEGVDVYYDDYPSENTKYNFLLENTFNVVLKSIEDRKDSMTVDQRFSISDGLKAFILENQANNVWYFDRIQSVLETVISLKGISGFSDVLEVLQGLGLREPHGDLIPSSISVDDLEFDYSDTRFFHKGIIKAISTSTWEDSEKPGVYTFLTDLMEYNSFGSLHYYMEAFESLGLNDSVAVLLKNVRSEVPIVQRMSSEILHRLELGKVGITESFGIEYLDKVYKLIREGDPDFFVNLYSSEGSYVQRLDTSGRIGVLDSSKKLLGAFDMNLESRESSLEVPVLDITVYDVFLPKADETPTEKQSRESMLLIYLSHYGEIYDSIAEETGIRINELELYEQGWFINSYIKATPESKKVILDLTKKYGLYGLKTFLALDYSGNSDLLSIDLDSSRETEDLLKLFCSMSKYALDFRGIFDDLDSEASKSFSPELHEALIRKASEYLLVFKNIVSTKDSETLIGPLLRSMSDVREVMKDVVTLFKNPDMFRLIKYPEIKKEFIDLEGKNKEDSVITWNFQRKDSEDRLVISIRSNKTYKVGNSFGGDPRINIRLVRKDHEDVRLALDVDSLVENRLSLDIGHGNIKNDNGDHPTSRVTRLLSSLKSSEGGHTFGSFSNSSSSLFSSITLSLKDKLNALFGL